MFEPHEEYSKLLAGAHRRRVTTITAPAAIRHLAFWNPPQFGPLEEGSPAEEDGKTSAALPIKKRTEAADQCIAAVYTALLAKSREEPAPICEITTNCEIVGKDGSAVLILLGGAIGAADGLPRPCPKGVKPDSYRAVKIFLRFHRIKVTLSFELHTEFLALTTVLDASEHWAPDQIDAIHTGSDTVLRDFHDAMFCLASVRGTDDARCRHVHQQLYHAIWDAADQEMLAPLASLQDLLGKKFIDFRGVVLGVKGEHARSDFSAPFSRKPPDKGTGLERDPQCSINDFDSLWNFITCALPSETEFTLSRFLENRAFYATALGVQPEVFLGSKHSPLYYLLFEDTLNPWQLGRLIYRIHRAGSARIAAIMHFGALRGARDILARVDSTLEKATWRPSQYDDMADPELRLKLREHQADVEIEIAKLSKLKLDGTIDSRIERSRYYVNQFTRVTEGLRIKRVAGFQPYDEFVNQRMGPVFENIESLGRMYARVQNDRAALQGRIQTLDSMHQEGLIADAQRIADIALSCALGPYYVGAIISHALQGLIPERTVWLTATVFGLTMFGLIKMGPEGQHLSAFWSGRPRSAVLLLLATRFRRVALALLIAAPAAIILNGMLPPPPTAAVGHSDPSTAATTVPAKSPGTSQTSREPTAASDEPS